ncbi:MAG TPA: Calx-beta domain-containing protein, partial [Pyrinomonadaceae bacterium]|nr:Calx-beta domain-containing protein [Pyrinomonadaceae bacterium]
RAIWLFDLSPTGQLTQLATTQMTSSGADEGSNLVLSGSGQLGFVLVNSNNGSTGFDLVSFSLVDGSIVKRFAVGGDGDMAMTEAGGKRLLTFFKNISTVQVVDATDVLNPVNLGDVALPRNTEFSATLGNIVISGDGHYAFVADQFADFAVIDLTTRQVVSTIGGAYRFNRVALFEDAQRRLLALQSSQSGTGGVQVILLIDATDPTHLSIVNQLNDLTQSFPAHFGFSKDASRLAVTTRTGIAAYTLPSFSKVWEQPLPESLPLEIKTYGATDEILGAWSGSGSQGFPATFGAFPFSPPNVSVTNASVNEGDTGTVAANFNSTLSAPTNHQVTVKYLPNGGNATSGVDYSNASGSVVFAPGETAKTFAVSVTGDTIDEVDETFNLSLTASVGILTSNQVIGTIVDDDPPPAASIADGEGSEGNEGNFQTADLVVTLSKPSGKSISLGYTLMDGTATSADYVNTSGTVSFSPGQTTSIISVPLVGDTVNEGDETFFVTLTNPSNVTIDRGQATGTVTNDDMPIFRFQTSSYTFGENVGSGSVVVLRLGDTSVAVKVNYATGDLAGNSGCTAITGRASARCDYETTAGTLNFAAGETAKSISIPIVDDAYAEGLETFSIGLSDPMGGGAVLFPPSATTIRITDNETVNGTNPVDQASFFVRMHYLDFLNREPDPAGLAFWSNQITECQQPGATCSAEVRRINVSAAFFLSIEFQETGYFVYRTYTAAYGNIAGTPVPLTLAEFLPDTQQIGKDVIVGQPGADQLLEAHKVAFMLDFVSRSRFTAAYPTTLTPAQFVDSLFLKAGVTPSAIDRNAAINEFGGAGNTTDTAARARALRRVTENSTLKQQETNRAFVLMQYFGYLRRNPNDPPELNLDFGGYNFWLGKLNQFNGNFVDAEMVKAFIISGEYRQRFGP